MLRTSLIIASLSTVAIALATYQLQSRSARRRKLPPGPRPSIFSNTHASPPNILPWKLFAQLRSIFGDIAYIDGLGTQLLVLNSAKATQDLLVKRSAIYSSRPNRLMILDVMGWNCMFSEMMYGSKWRSYRSLFEKYYNPRAVEQYQPIQLAEAHSLLRNLLASPENFALHIQRSATALIMMISYGHQIADLDDPYVTLSEQAMGAIIKAGIPGTYWIDWLPWLNHVPTWFPAPFRKVGNACRAATDAMIAEPFKMIERRTHSGKNTPCIVSRELEETVRCTDSEDHTTILKNVAAMGYAAGGETTVSGLHTFFLAMTLYPKVQAKAQAELDRVLASESRLPRFSDRSQLPFIDHVVWEVMRWNPVVPLGLQHATTEDDTYEGYLIPKGTAVVPNVWAIFHDENTYPEAFEFKPERFEGPNEAGINEIPMAAFGFGRRICPGRWLALDTLWITVASVLAVYNISKALDDAGNTIDPNPEDYTLGLSSRPKPFVCSIKPRSAAASVLIHDSTTVEPQ